MPDGAARRRVLTYGKLLLFLHDDKGHGPFYIM